MHDGMSYDDYEGVIEITMHAAFSVSVAKTDAVWGTVSEFVLPAAGQYWLANPRFTNAGDLTFDLGLRTPKIPQE